jgi:excinuclease ABC subunit C
MKRRRYKFSLAGKPLYPHIKITPEKFPRLLATRLIENDGAEYFGAFLNRTNARLLIDFLNRVFRLRSCDIAIDGSFNYPCTQYYKRRCIAPCTKDLCTEPEYNERVEWARMFLANDRAGLAWALQTRIAAASKDLDFETAARLRDLLNEIEAYWKDESRGVWVDRTTDTFHVRNNDGIIDILLVTQRGRRILGERVFTFKGDTSEEAQAISDVIRQFYVVHAPKEVRVSIELPDRIELQRTLSAIAGRKVPIRLVKESDRRVATQTAITRSSAELDIARLDPKPTPKKLLAELRKVLSLDRAVRSITAIDVSHISGTDVVAAAVTWESGKFLPSEYVYRSYEASELASIAALAAERVTHRLGSGELLLIDGGAPQLRAVMKAIGQSNVRIAAAVKPPKRHSEISHFLREDGTRIENDPSVRAFQLLKNIRDEVHAFANAVHRDVRDFAEFYQLAAIIPSISESSRQELVKALGSQAKVLAASDDRLAVILGHERAAAVRADIINFNADKSIKILPLVVPTRLQEPGTAADDLRPIERRSRA